MLPQPYKSINTIIALFINAILVLLSGLVVSYYSQWKPYISHVTSQHTIFVEAWYGVVCAVVLNVIYEICHEVI